MDPEQIKGFVRRDWASAAAAKRAYWRERSAIGGWRVAWDAAQALLMHVRAVRPDFPSERDRSLDLAHHASVRATLDLAAHAFANVPVASAEDIVVMKILAGRQKDLDDVTSIVGTNVALDVGYVRETLAILERALAQSDLLPALDAALAQVEPSDEPPAVSGQ